MSKSKQQLLFGQQRFETFLEFYRHNPEFYVMFRRYAIVVQESGTTRYAARNIVERIRWHVQIENKLGNFKINNNVIPYYSRLLMVREPGLFGDFFERRDRRFDIDDVTLSRETDAIDSQRLQPDFCHFFN